eukprot:scaffold7106_cov126-Skeletonema_dohrnii-CCMP3373.AAC.1
MVSGETPIPIKRSLQSVSAPHIFCSLNTKANSVASQQEGQKGKRASHPFVFVWTGHCTGTAETQKKEGDEDVGCTTTYIGGLTVKFSGRCLHHSRKAQGAARKRKMYEKKPKEMTQSLIGQNNSGETTSVKRFTT